MMFDVIIIGSGPAAYTAAIYLARANLVPLMLEGMISDTITPGGLLTTTDIVENFPGFPDGISGNNLIDNMRAQAEKFNTIFKSETAIKIKIINKLFEVYTDNNCYQTKTVIIATGSTPNELNVPGYSDFKHRGISTCAVCDGGLPCFRNKNIAVVGGGDSACEEALYLTHYAKQVYLIHRRDKLRASQIMQLRVFAHPKIQIIFNSEITRVAGNLHLNSIDILNNVDNKKTILEVNGLFVAIGHTPNSDFVSGLINVDANKYIITNRHQETNIRGIYAIGDVQDPHYKQAITAAGSGCIAALEVERYLRE